MSAITQMDRMMIHSAAQPHERDFVEFVDEVCGIYFRSILLQKGEKAKQHVHDYDHATYLGAGSVKMWANGELVGEFKAGTVFPVLSGVLHEFMALEDNTRIACVHTAESAESAKAKGI